MEIAQHVAVALMEDVGQGDVSAALIDDSETSQAEVTCREHAVLCGTEWFSEVFRQLDNQTSVKWEFKDGDRVKPGDILCRISGKSRTLLTAERTALNFLQLLSGTATQTARYADLISHTRCKLLDTRKTVPGFRVAQKYAVRCGGGTNHRLGLFDQVLIKENHIHAAGSVRAAVDRARIHNPKLKVEIEVEDLNELKEAVEASPEIIMLDNFEIGVMQEAVAFVSGRVLLEASGGVDLNTITSIAETGVDFVSIGDVTKNIRAVDLSMRFV